nr:reverse transcriptase domain-containing protein [Tanacetum cinerariifolium]
MRTRSRSRSHHKIAEPLRIEFPSQEDQFQEDPQEVPIADNRTMAQLLQAPIEGYEDAIVIPEIAATNFELKHGIINLVQNKQFFGHEDPHAHICYFNKITSTMRIPNVPNSTIKLMLFPFSLEGAARIWLEKEPPRFILTWDDLVSKFINQFFPPSKMTNLRNEITRFSKDLTNRFLKHGIVSMICLGHASLNSAAGGNFLDKMPSDCLKIIESKSKVRQSRAKAVIAKVNSSSSTPAISSDVAELKDIVRALLLEKKNQSSAPSPTPAPVKAVEPNCVTCDGAGTLPGPTIPTPSKVVKQRTKVTKDQVQTPSSQSTAPVRPLVAQSETPVFEPVVAPCLAFADLGASINLMPLSVWEGLSLSELTPTCMTLELADRLVSKPISIAKDVLVKTDRALIDVYKDELTLRIENEAITYNLDQTSRYSANYDQMTANKINVTDEACEEYSQEVLGFSDVTVSGSPTPSDDLIVFTTSPTLTPFEDSDFLLFEEADAFLGLEDDPDSLEFDPSYYDPEGDILLLEAILNSEPSPPLPDHEQSMPSFKNELKACEAKTIKSSVDEPPEVEFKDLPPHLEYVFLEGDNKLPVIIAKELGDEEISALIKVLKSHKRAITWKLSDIQGINPEFCTHKILMEEDYKPAVQHQRRVNPKIHDVIKKEVEKLLDAGLIYPIFDSPWVSPIHWNEYYCFLDGFSGYFQIPIDPRDQEKTTFTCPYGTCAYRRMPFGLCNAPGTFQRCMLAIFHDMVEKTMEVFMDDFSVFGNSFENCLSYLDKMLKRCEDTKLCLNWEKSHFMVKEDIVLGHKISKNGIEVDKAKIDVITKLPHPTTVKGYSVHFSEDCIKAFQTIKKKLTEAPILVAPNWDLPFELMCDASDFAIGAVLGQRHEKHFRPIHYASKTLTDAESNYTTTEKEMLAVVYAFEKFRSYLIMNKSIVHTDHSALNYPFAKKDAKARLLRILEMTIVQNRASWSDKLDDALWAFRTAYKIPIGCTPYKLVYEKACHLLMELEHKADWALKQANFDLAVAGDHRKIQLNKLNELRDQAYENSLIYKEKTKRIHDSKIKNHIFNVGDRVLLFNSRLKIFSGKLKTRWSRPFTITKVFPYGTVELSQANGPNFKVNGHRISTTLEGMYHNW